MSDADRVQLGWKQPPEWDRFEASVAETWGATSPYCGFAIEQAWNEFRDEHPIEEHADTILRAVGLGAGYSEKNSQLTQAADGDCDERVWVRVHADTKADMEAYAAAHDTQKYVLLRALVNWHLDGGLLGKTTAKLAEAAPEVETLAAQIDDDSADDGSLSATERRVRTLCRALTGDTPTFDLTEFKKAMNEDVRGCDYSDYTRETYLPRVCEHLGYEQHPKINDVYVPAARAAEIRAVNDDVPAADAPPHERRQYDDLDTAERELAVQIEAARAAQQNPGLIEGKGSLPTEYVCEHVYRGDGPTQQMATQIMKGAAEDASGYRYDTTRGTARLTCDLDAVDDPDVRDALADDHAADSDAESSDDLAGAVADRLADLDAATAARTDGGEP